MNKILLNTFIIGAAVSTTLIGADASAQMNLKNSRPDLYELFNDSVNEQRLALDDETLSLMELDPESLRWVTGADPIEVYFINEGAAYRNILSYTANGGEKQVIFEDVSSPESLRPDADGPLALGDGVSLGEFDGDTQLDFFLTPTFNGWVGKSIGSDPAQNADGLQHIVAQAFYDDIEGEWWTLIGFEDMSGPLGQGAGFSDRDFNDTVFAVRGIIGDPVENEAVPEPASILGLLGIAALGVSRIRRHNG